jgi:tetratricopeptide (TPR) repeat protein
MPNKILLKQNLHSPKRKAAILDDLGYCFLRLGWFEEAAKVYTEYPNILPFDNDARFFLASAYASLGWKGDAVKELGTILASDPDDVLACHNLALCYRDMGWSKDSLEEMRKTKAYAMISGNPEEKELIGSSLAHLEHEIENGDDGGIPLCAGWAPSFQECLITDA